MAWFNAGSGGFGLISSDNASVTLSLPFLPEERFGSGNYGLIWKSELDSRVYTSDDPLSVVHYNKTSATAQDVGGTGQLTVNFFNSNTRYAWFARGTLVYKLDSTVV